MTNQTAPSINKVVLAYSGGLDTSVILKWLQETYNCEVITFTADLGQGEDIEPARAKAEMLGIKQIYIEDLREEFVRDYVFPMFRANALYEGLYLLGTSIARPLIAKDKLKSQPKLALMLSLMVPQAKAMIRCVLSLDIMLSILILKSSHHGANGIWHLAQNSSLMLRPTKFPYQKIKEAKRLSL